jgi:crotonobetainyl-CoA:carnitine CoA-transferase CaiB-like acyl-CoA transferase
MLINQSLDSITVLDFSQVGAGPTVGMLLGDLGAEVIKIEGPEGDIGRKLGPPWQGGESVVSMSFNRNKRSLAIDLKQPRAVEIMRSIIARCDVLIESFRPGVMKRLGLDYERVAVEHPGLIYCSVSAYGQSGPWAGKPGVDGIVQAVSGLMSNIGTQDSPPMKVLVPAADMVTGYLATVAVLAALHQRARSGGVGSQHLDMSMFNSAVMLQQSALASYLSSGELPVRTGTAAPYSAPNEAYPTQDGWIMIAAYHEDRWRALCRVLGAPELAQDPRFSSNAQRVAHRHTLMQVLSQKLSSRSSADWQARLEAADIICGPIADYHQLLASAQLQHNGVIVETLNRRAGRVRMPGAALGDRDAQSRVRRGPPVIGEHSLEILRQFGIDAAECEQLQAQGVITQYQDSAAEDDTTGATR